MIAARRRWKWWRKTALFRTYKKGWANSPYPPTFVTVAQRWLCSRATCCWSSVKPAPDLGQMALPGGFLRK